VIYDTGSRESGSGDFVGDCAGECIGDLLWRSCFFGDVVSPVIRVLHISTRYDPYTDQESTTYIGHSGHGTYTCTMPVASEGKSRRKQKEIALDAIEAAIEGGDEPGEVSDERRDEAERQYQGRIG
jgi:hypothetical protein